MLREVLWTVVRGFLMGAADVVPGVSGGTIALVLGIYERLVAAIRAGSSALGHLLKGDLPGVGRWLRRVEWSFLLPLLAGIGIAVGGLARVIEAGLSDFPVEMAALFLGLVSGSIVIAWRMLGRRDLVRMAILVVVAVVVFVLLGLRESTTPEAVAQAATPAVWAFFGAGALAICAMILPGISGSFILVLLGMYAPVLAAVNDRDVVAVAVFGLGAVVGLALFSQLLHWALAHHHDTVMAALIGLMGGSLRVLWPWPAGLETTALGVPSGPVLVPVVLGAVGAATVVAVHLVAERMNGRIVHTAADGTP